VTHQQADSSDLKEKTDRHQEVTLTEDTKKLIRRNRTKCFLCRMIITDIKKNGKLTGYPEDFSGKGTFPVEGKMSHVKKEKEAEKKRMEVNSGKKK
jgi:hypothetical protein